MQTITCSDLNTFCAIVAKITEAGLAFKANADILTIEITGF